MKYSLQISTLYFDNCKLDENFDLVYFMGMKLGNYLDGTTYMCSFYVYKQY